jgi:predicted translin family RNA/ssDNA-binding protein
MDLQQLYDKAMNEGNFDRATVIYNIVDEVISRIENALKDFREDYSQEYNNAKQVYLDARWRGCDD